MLQKIEYDVLKEFLKGYFKEIHGRGVFNSKKIKASQRTISRVLSDLEERDFLDSRVEGNIKYYSLNKANPIIEDLLIFLESLRSFEFLNENKKLIDFSKEIPGEIVCVFGSYANGKQKKKSDLDIYVVGKVNTNEIRDIGKKYGFDVQVFNVWLKNFRKSIKEKYELFCEVLLNHVVLKGKERFVREVLQNEKKEI